MNPWPLSLEGVSHHEYWRLWTAHVFHCSWPRLLVNMFCLLPPVLLVPRRMLRALPFWILVVMPLLSLALLWIPGLEYCGSAGWVSAVWSLAGAILMRLRRKEDHVWGTVLVSLLIINLSSDAYGIRLPEPEAGLHTLPLAQQVGALLGLLSGLFWPLKRLFGRSGKLMQS